jgi:hypothetical protein
MRVSPSMVPGDQYLSGLSMFLFRTIRSNLVLTVLLPLASVLIAYVAALQMPTVHTAQGSIRIGRVDGAETISPMGMVSRINSLAFKQRVVQRMNFPSAEGARPARLIFSSLVARQETPEAVGVSVQATTAQQAHDVVAVAVNLLNEDQRKTGEPLEADIKEQIATHDATIARLLETRETLSALTKEESKEVSGDPASAMLRRVWLSDLVSRNEQRLVTTRAERHALSAKLGAWRTYPTVLFDEPFVSSGFAFARPLTIATFAGAVVFLVFLIHAMLRQPKAVPPD